MELGKYNWIISQYIREGEQQDESTCFQAGKPAPPKSEVWYHFQESDHCNHNQVSPAQDPGGNVLKYKQGISH